MSKSHSPNHEGIAVDQPQPLATAVAEVTGTGVSLNFVEYLVACEFAQDSVERLAEGE